MGVLGGLFERSLALGGSTVALLRSAMAAGPELGLQELENKLDVFRAYRYPQRALGGSAAGLSQPLAARVAKVEDLAPFDRLWVSEGLGDAHAESYGSLTLDDPSILGFEHCGPLPVGRLLALHTGLGLSLARSLLPLRPLGSDALAGKLRDFEILCNRQARPGYAPAVIEALGLVVMTLQPDALASVDLALVDIGLVEPTGERRALFWHGVGRGLYFAPSLAIPGSSGLALERARELASDDLGRANVIAGFAWALSLVNLRHPRILASRLRRVAALSPLESSAFEHGVISAAAVARDSLGWDFLSRAFLSHGERGGRSPERERWRRWVANPVKQALCEAGRTRTVALGKGWNPFEFEVDKRFRYPPAKVVELGEVGEKGA